MTIFLLAVAVVAFSAGYMLGMIREYNSWRPLLTDALDNLETSADLLEKAIAELERRSS